MDKSNYFLIISIVGGLFVASLSRIWKMLNNTNLLKRKDDGSIHWSFEISYLFINSLLGGLVGLGAYLLLDYTNYITDKSLLTFISCMFASASGEVFTLVQAKVIKTVEEMKDKDLEDATR